MLRIIPIKRPTSGQPVSSATAAAVAGYGSSSLNKFFTKGLRQADNALFRAHYNPSDEKSNSQNGFDC